MAVRALVEVDARVRRHRLKPFEAAVRTPDRRFKNERCQLSSRACRVNFMLHSSLRHAQPRSSCHPVTAKPPKTISAMPLQNVICSAIDRVGPIAPRGSCWKRSSAATSETPPSWTSEAGSACFRSSSLQLGSALPLTSRPRLAMATSLHRKRVVVRCLTAYDWCALSSGGEGLSHVCASGLGNAPPTNEG